VRRERVSAARGGQLPAGFHPAVAAWFGAHFTAPTDCQRRAWPAISAGRHTLIAAPTGSGKTLAAFLHALDALVRESRDAPLPDATRVLYVSPLKALGNDVQRNLEMPLEGIASALAQRGLARPGIRTRVRTGDTPAAAREAMRRQPPHVLVTTPESLYILLTSDGGRRMLATVRTVIVDEIHAVAASKRGAHLALSLERLDTLVAAEGGARAVRIGLSATQEPVAEMARFLVGAHAVGADGAPDCSVVDMGHARARDLAIELPGSPLEAVMSGEVWGEVYDRIADLAGAHRTTLVFVNTRRMAERVARHLSERIGEDGVSSHHGSLAREHRLAVEQRLKRGELRVLVATASLELGIDVGDVDLVCQLGSTRSITVWLQRAGRSGHALGATAKARLFPLSRDDLVECTALLDAVGRGELDRLAVPRGPLDVLAQQLVATVATGEWDEDALYDTVRRAWPYRGLARADFDAVVRMLADGVSTRRGRRAAHLHRDAVHRRLRARRGARLAAITCGGAIPDNADYDVVLEPAGTLVGTLNEDFAIESLPGQIFQLGNTSWRILRIEAGKVRVEDAHGQPPNIPFWFGEAPGRSDELSAAVARLRAGVAHDLDDAGDDAAGGGDGDEAAVARAAARLVARAGVEPAAAAQTVAYLAAARAALGALPDARHVVIERFFDESGGMQLVIHSPAGSRINKAWGLALRKRFCRQFNFELQAAATEDAIVLSLGETHSFALAEVPRYLHSASVRGVLVQALLDAPVFPVRWRWAASIALAVQRFRGGRKVPPALQRIQSEDLLSVVFPDQLACLENLAGEREIPDHPLVDQTLRDCLEEAMDAAGLERLLGEIERGERHVVTADLTGPSPLAREILGARPYAFLDDAPLEERRTQAVIGRRWLDPESARDLGRLDAEAIRRVREEAWPAWASPDELHDALLVAGFLTADEVAADDPHLEALRGARRAAWLTATDAPSLAVAAERLPELAALRPDAAIEPPLEVPADYARGWEPEAALIEILRARLGCLGPVRAGTLARAAGVERGAVERALAALESEGFVLRGQFTPGAADPGPGGEGAGEEWCERRLLARVHRDTVGRLRREIEPVASADFLRFLIGWHRLGDPLHGARGLGAVLESLEGFAAPAASWESSILPARVADYDPAWLDAACLAGRVAWARPRPRAGRGNGAAGPGARQQVVRGTPVCLAGRATLGLWAGGDAPPGADGAGDPATGLSPAAASAHAQLSTRGACFFDDLQRAAGLDGVGVEAALGELVAAGLAASDGFEGLRALIGGAAPGRRGGHDRQALRAAGRWSLVSGGHGDERADGEPAPPRPGGGWRVEAIARTLLRRYGVVFRRLLARESGLPPWRELLACYRRLEARGDIRGGRFVAGFPGEQFALPEAVAALRNVRRRPGGGTLVTVAAADPLNLVGIVTPGERVPALAGNRVLFRDGVPLAARIGREVRLLAPCDDATARAAEHALHGDGAGRRRPARRRPRRGAASAPRPREHSRGQMALDL